MIRNTLVFFIAIIVILMYTIAIYLGLHPEKYSSIERRDAWELKLKK